MKIRSMVAFAGTLCFTGSLIQAAITDITISDGLLADSPGGSGSSNGLFGPTGTTDPRFPNDAAGQKQREFSEVENGNSEYSSWDLRAFGYDADNKRLIYQGGMDISREVNGSNTPTGTVTSSTQIASGSYGIGSIFIKIGTDSSYAPPIWSNAYTSNGNYADITNGSVPDNNNTAGGGFDYAITLRSTVQGTLSYEIYGLVEASILTLPYFGSNDEAGPYAFLPERNQGNTALVSGKTATVELKTDNQLPSGLNDFNVSNYIAGFDLGDVIGKRVNEKGAFFYLTQECGNDSLVGRVIAVPEPGNMVGLMGLLVGGAFLRFRRRA